MCVIRTKGPKVICDPVHRLITFDQTPGDRLLLDLIDSKEFQRLRRIKQLGLSDLVFPGATHTRFLHSIGVMHFAKKFLTRIEQITGADINPLERILIISAALLHDVGHGPFSHAFEKAVGDHHEQRTVEIIRCPDTEIHRILTGTDPELPELVAGFFDRLYDILNGATGYPPYLGQIISSQFDADRSDYLLRDSHATGADYGFFDFEWLLSQLYVDDARRLYLNMKALSGVEAYIFARYHMYQSVYFHKTTRAAEIMLQLAFTRFRELLETLGPAAVRRLLPHLPTPVLYAFFEHVDLSCYLILDDGTIYEFLKTCANCGDPILMMLGAGILSRRLFKVVESPFPDPGDHAKFLAAATDVIGQMGYNPAYSLYMDTLSDTPYNPYDPTQHQPATQIYIDTPSGEVEEISRVSPTIQALIRTYTRVRFYCIPEAKTKIQALMNNL